MGCQQGSTCRSLAQMSSAKAKGLAATLRWGAPNPRGAWTCSLGSNRALDMGNRGVYSWLWVRGTVQWLEQSKRDSSSSSLCRAVLSLGWAD